MNVSVGAQGIFVFLRFPYVFMSTECMIVRYSWITSCCKRLLLERGNQVHLLYQKALFGRSMSPDLISTSPLRSYVTQNMESSSFQLANKRSLSSTAEAPGHAIYPAVRHTHNLTFSQHHQTNSSAILHSTHSIPQFLPQKYTSNHVSKLDGHSTWR